MDTATQDNIRNTLERDAQDMTREQAMTWVGIEQEHLPQHVAFIMDGNGRWAQSQNKPRTFGHARGAMRIKPIIERAGQLGMKMVTFYSFSTENWRRSPEEVDYLMDLCVQYLIDERENLVRNNARVVHLGQREGLPARVLDQIDLVVEATQHCTGLTVGMAINYGSRAEITDAVRQIAQQIHDGQITPREVTEQLISDHLNTAHLPDPDLMVRTAGEMRLSNYLLWQLSYAELYVADICWPEFSLDKFREALHAYARRKRNFGGVER